MTAGTKTGTAAVTITLRSGLKKTIRVIVQKMAVRTTKLTRASIFGHGVKRENGKTYTGADTGDKPGKSDLYDRK